MDTDAKIKYLKQANKESRKRIMEFQLKYSLYSQAHLDGSLRGSQEWEDKVDSRIDSGIITPEYAIHILEGTNKRQKGIENLFERMEKSNDL